MEKHTEKKNNLKIILLPIILLIIVGLIFFGHKIIEPENQENIPISEKQENLENNNSKEENPEPEQEETPEQDIFEKYYIQAEALIENMTIEEKVGQMFLVRFPESGEIEEIENYKPGGYILFGRDFKNETKASITNKLAQCQEASQIPLILGVDEEGGTVVRVSNYKAFRKSKFLSPQDLFQKGGLDAIIKDSTEKTTLLKSLGLNMNLAPVADVSTNSSDFIYKRAYGKNAEETAKYVSEVIKTMNNDGIISTMKHFPGYGNNIDTHTEIAIDERPYETFETSDFLPFKSGIDVGAPTILVSHNIVKSMDENNPASLSTKIHSILRYDLGFSGIIMTDDLAMDAVKTYTENGEAAVQAVLAGNDMIISSDFKTQRQEVLNAISEGKIDEELIDMAVRRILACKYAYGIIK